MSLLGLAFSLGVALPAGAQMQPQPSPTAQAITLDDTHAAPAVAMGHGTADPSTEDPSTEDPSAMDEPEAVMPPRPSASVPLTAAAHGDFAVGFPQGWLVSHGETQPHLTGQSPAGEAAITTEVSWYAEAPGQIVPTLLADIQEKGHTVARYDAVAVDGTTALRLWLTDLPAPDRPYAFITVVGYSDATAILVSHYETSSHDLDNLLNQIHQSFQRGEAATATDTHPHP